MKKLTALLLILAMEITLTACGSNATQGDTPEQTPSGETPTPTPTENQTPTPTPDSSGPDNVNETPTATPLQEQGIWDTIEFGGYDWLVLDEQDGKKLIISQNVIEYREYHSEFTDITWAESDIRYYLNGEFINNNFTDDEKNSIAETEVINNDNPWFGTYGGTDTTDKVFLLSLDEVVRYFGDSGQLYNRPSDDTPVIDDAYNTERMAYDADGNVSIWWLRSPGSLSHNAALVSPDGRVNVYGNYATFDIGVRPALWLNHVVLRIMERNQEAYVYDPFFTVTSFVFPMPAKTPGGVLK